MRTRRFFAIGAMSLMAFSSVSFADMYHSLSNGKLTDSFIDRYKQGLENGYEYHDVRYGVYKDYQKKYTKYTEEGNTYTPNGWRHAKIYIPPADSGIDWVSIGIASYPNTQYRFHLTLIPNEGPAPAVDHVNAKQCDTFSNFYKCMEPGITAEFREQSAGSFRVNKDLMKKMNGGWLLIDYTSDTENPNIYKAYKNNGTEGFEPVYHITDWDKVMNWLKSEKYQDTNRDPAANAGSIHVKVKKGPDTIEEYNTHLDGGSRAYDDLNLDSSVNTTTSENRTGTTTTTTATSGSTSTSSTSGATNKPKTENQCPTGTYKGSDGYCHVSSTTQSGSNTNYQRTGDQPCQNTPPAPGQSASNTCSDSTGTIASVSTSAGETDTSSEKNRCPKGTIINAATGYCEVPENSSSNSSPSIETISMEGESGSSSSLESASSVLDENANEVAETSKKVNKTLAQRALNTTKPIFDGAFFKNSEGKWIYVSTASHELFLFEGMDSDGNLKWEFISSIDAKNIEINLDKKNIHISGPAERELSDKEPSLVGKDIKIEGFFIHIGEGKNDWAYILPDGSQGYRLNGLEDDGEHIKWIPLWTK